jgi:hypothetical protein
MEGELFQKVGFIAEVHHIAIFHIALGNLRNLNKVFRPISG